MTLPTRARIAGFLAISLLMLGAPGALAGSLTPYRPDAQIATDAFFWLGDDTYEPDGASQWWGVGATVGTTVAFHIKIENDGNSSDSFKVSRSAGYTDGYRVRYYDAAMHDVTGQVTTGTFTTPSVAPGANYVMHATVKIKSWATACSSTSRRITVRSVGNSTLKDAVRFTVEPSAPPC